LKTAVVILNWNGKHLMESFLPALIASLDTASELIIADNASSDDSVLWLKNTYPTIRIIQNKTNEGFAKGYNTALEQVNADYLLLLNSDVEVKPGWLQPLEKCLDNNPEIAVCQPKLLWQKQKEYLEYGGAAGGYIDKFGYPFCRGRIFGFLEKDLGQYNQTIPVFWASGACMLVRTSVYKAMSGFDPLFFAHMEEIDLCWRIRNAGHKIVCVPESVVYHVGGATLPKNNPGKTFLNFRNNLSMLYKNLPGNRVLPVILLRLVLDGIAGVKFLTEGHWRDCFAVIRAHWAFYGRLFRGELKRNKSEIKISHPTIYRGCLVIDHYLLGKKHFTDLNFHPDKK
jgi:GT2 family glycosyltransferase